MPPGRRPYTSDHRRWEKVLSFAYQGGWPGRLWGRLPQARRVQRLEHVVEVARDPERPPLRIAFASDLHLGPTTAEVTLDSAFGHLEAAGADVLALGGDYVFLGATPERVQALSARVARVPAALKIAVMGNHDFWARPARLEVALSAAGTLVLVDEVVRLPPPHDDVALLGLDDPLTSLDEATQRERREAVAALFEHTRDAAVRVVVCHSPDGLLWVRGLGAQLMLCGHTHGGHLALPGYRPLVMPSRVGKLYPHGLHRVDGTHLFVSRGVGGSSVPMRTWAPPDVAVFTLRAAGTDALDRSAAGALTSPPMPSPPPDR